DHALAGTIEIFEDRRLLLGESDLAAAAVDQQFRGWLESVGTDGEDGVLALLVLPELGADARKQHAELERLGDVVVGASFKTENGVGIGGLPGQHDDGTLEPTTAEQLASLTSVEIGKADV